MMKGFTLIEVVISILIASMAVMASFSVVLSSFVSADKAEKKQEAATIIRYASEKLKEYVSADPTLGAPYALPGGGIWGDDLSGKWALDASGSGKHDITPLLDRLDPDLTFGGGSRKLEYRVRDMACGAFTCKEVTFKLKYNE